MNLRQIYQFIAVAEALNFRKAAERLHMAQPPLSVSIKRLEEDLDCPLFFRERRGLRLTPAGEAILSHARQISFHSGELRKSAANASGGLAGVLRIGFVGSTTYTLFPRALPQFRKRYPRVSLDLRERTTTQILREIESGELDLGFVRYPVSEATRANLLPVEHDQLVAVLPVNSPLARKKRLKLIDLAQEPFIMYSSVSALNLRGQVISACQAEGFTPTVAQEAVQVQTIISLVESGMGVALVPSVSQAQASTGVVFRPLLGATKQLDVAIAVATHPDTEPPAATRFRNLLVELEATSKT
ncbi:LysR family transcriptional regulator [Polaromonas sp. UC242_47]|uniref:LysR family transcriptional regulator n=1 Tax=Polaromonas sp. UC242_47 TaxID=3374626 RepID=UPI0037CBFAF1